MRKVGFIMFLGLVTILASQNAWAIKDVVTGTGAASTTIATEVIDPSAGYIHNAAKAVRFKIETGIAAGKRLVVAITNASFENINSLKVCNAGADNTFYNADDTTPIAAPAVTDTTKRRAEFVAPAALAADDEYYISEACGAGAALVIKIDPGATSVAVTVATDDSAETNPSATNKDFYKAQQQFAMSADLNLHTETIDVEKDLQKFVPVDTLGVLNTQTTAYLDNGLATALKAADTNPDIKAVIVTNVLAKFSVLGKMDGIKSIQFVDTKGTPGTTDDVVKGSFTIDPANQKAEGSIKLTDLLNGNIALKLDVDGTKPLESRILSIGASLTPADDVKVGTTLIDGNATAAKTIVGPNVIAAGKEKWQFSINGLQFVAPYVRHDGNVTSALRIENVSGRDTKAWFFVNDTNGEWKLVKTEAVSKGGVLVKTGESLINEAASSGVSLDGTKGFAVWGVVKGAPGDNKNITVYGSQQYVTGAFRPLPIQVLFGSWTE
ncbi:MAG: hypothetical protein QXQ66_09010 [Candidatus Hadarchaeum sp.]|uniref:hypothetical protein n=1 Tax=Candidatus Hadarchaeum sp. TaxID=2883567 RepID=UPI00317946BC